MGSSVDRKAEPRVPLSLERLLEAAIHLADEGGLDSLTMRKLGRKLGVEVMSLYYYVAKKDDILDGILDLVVTEIDAVTQEPTGWKPAIRASAISAHEALERHPWACGLWMSSGRVRPGRLRYMESMLGRLREAGFSAESTDRAYHALDSHIVGSTLWEVGYSGVVELPEDYGATFLRSLPAGRYPYLAEHIEQHLSIPEPGETAFEFGLDLILDGLERIRVAG